MEEYKISPKRSQGGKKKGNRETVVIKLA